MTSTSMRPFGKTGLRVSEIGFGAMHFDGIDDDSQVEALLNGVLDSGVNLIDTARGYGRSEERIGRFISHRRAEFVLSTKFGYGVDGVSDWTAACITQGVDRALKLMRTDVIDIGHLHSCPIDVLQRGEVSQALSDCVATGKLRVAAYSGENAELAHALSDSRFGSVQLSLSLADRSNLTHAPNWLGHGVLVKRALAGMAWTRPTRPKDFCECAYFDRWHAMSLPDLGINWPELALRFALHQVGVSSLLVGTKSLVNLRSAQASAAKGPLPADVLAVLDQAWASSGGAGWPGIV